MKNYYICGNYNSETMKNYAVLCFAVLCSAVYTAGAQNKDDGFERFRQMRQESQSEFEQQRAKEFEEFKAAYYDAFERFRQLYRRYLEDDKAVIDLMVSDDGIKLEPVKLAVQPKVVTSAADQKKIIEDNLRQIEKMGPEDLVPVLSDEQDSVARMQEAAETMKSIVSAMEPDAWENGTPVSAEVAEVVLEPFDPEYFSKLPSVEEAEQVSEADVPVTSDMPAADTPEEKSMVSSAIPQGKPTDYVRISSPFGTRIHPITRKKHTHKGIDLAAPKMTPIYATADGKVTFSGRNGGYGNFVKLNHLNGYKTAYAHMHRIAVDNGDYVHKGDLIGYVGTTGSSTGNHLHYEVYYEDNLIDPATTL